jgi:hypothetical protein
VQVLEAPERRQDDRYEWLLDRQVHRFSSHWERLVLDTRESLRSGKGFRHMGAVIREDAIRYECSRLTRGPRGIAASGHPSECASLGIARSGPDACSLKKLSDSPCHVLQLNGTM